MRPVDYKARPEGHLKLSFQNMKAKEWEINLL